MAHPSPPTTNPSPGRPAVRSFTLNASAETGAAAFRLGDLGVVVIDDDVTLADAEGNVSLTPTMQPDPARSPAHGAACPR